VTHDRIALLVPDMPSADALLPWLRRIDASRWYSNFGPLVRELEAGFTAMFAAHEPGAHVSTVSNCTLGLELALLALGLPPGSRVLVPAVTFVATATAIIRAGHIPVITDVDPHSWMLTPEIAHAAARRDDIAAAMPVATFGCPHDAGAWDAFTAQTGIPVIIDAAGAFGNQWRCGTSTVVYSLHATKSLAAGEGGVVVSRNQALVAMTRQLSNFGINLDPRALTPVGQVAVPGSNAKMSEYHAAIGLANLERWPALSATRIALWKRYVGVLESMPGLEPVWQRAPEPLVRTLLCFRVRRPGLRAAIEVACAAAGIETRRWYLPALNLHDAFRELPTAGPLTESDRLCEELLGLPFHSAIDETHLRRVVDALTGAIGPVD
jgi:dTDP-4-amino-4,6-dideoxygalactose transaminase